MSPNDENEQLSTPSDKFELRKSTPSEFCRVFNLSNFGADVFNSINIFKFTEILIKKVLLIELVH